MSSFNKQFVFVPFKKRALKSSLIGIIMFVVCYLIVCLKSAEGDFVFVLAGIFIFFISRVVYREKFFLTSVTSNKSGINLEYYEYNKLKSLFVDWHSFTFDICYPLSKSGNAGVHLKFKNQDALIGNFFQLSTENTRELSYLLTKAKHDSQL